MAQVCDKTQILRVVLPSLTAINLTCFGKNSKKYIGEFYMSSSKPIYKAPSLYGVKESELTAMAANRFQGSTCCCSCTGHGISRG